MSMMLNGDSTTFAKTWRAEQIAEAERSTLAARFRKTRPWSITSLVRDFPLRSNGPANGTRGATSARPSSVFGA